MSWASWLDAIDRRLGDALARGAAPAAGTAGAEAGLALVLRALEAGACASEAFHRAHVLGAHGRFLFRTEDGLVAAHLVLDGQELRAGAGTGGRSADGGWDVAVVFRDAGCVASLLLSPSPDLVRALVRRELRVLGNVALLYKLGFMLADLGSRLGVRAEGAR